MPTSFVGGGGRKRRTWRECLDAYGGDAGETVGDVSVFSMGGRGVGGSKKEGEEEGKEGEKRGRGIYLSLQFPGWPLVPVQRIMMFVERESPAQKFLSAAEPRHWNVPFVLGGDVSIACVGKGKMRRVRRLCRGSRGVKGAEGYEDVLDHLCINRGQICSQDGCEGEGMHLEGF